MTTGVELTDQYRGYLAWHRQEVFGKYEEKA